MQIINNNEFLSSMLSLSHMSGADMAASIGKQQKSAEGQDFQSLLMKALKGEASEPFLDMAEVNEETLSQLFLQPVLLSTQKVGEEEETPKFQTFSGKHLLVESPQVLSPAIGESISQVAALLSQSGGAEKMVFEEMKNPLEKIPETLTDSRKATITAMGKAMDSNTVTAMDSNTVTAMNSTTEKPWPAPIPFQRQPSPTQGENPSVLEPKPLSIPEAELVPWNATFGVEQSPTPSPQVEKALPYAQIADKIGDAAAQGKPTELKMTLHPEELGEIQIKINISRGRLQIDISSEKADTLQVLSGQLEKLTTQLGLKQFQVEGITLNQSNNGTQPGNTMQQMMSGSLSSQVGYQSGERRNGSGGKTNHSKVLQKIGALTPEVAPPPPMISGMTSPQQRTRLDYIV